MESKEVQEEALFRSKARMQVVAQKAEVLSAHL